MAFTFATKAPGHDAAIEVAPEGYVVTQIVLLVYLFGPLFDSGFDFVLDCLQGLLATFDSIKELNNVLG